MPKQRELTVSLANQPGKLFELCSTLSRAGVNIRSLFVPEIPRGKRGKVRLLVDDEEKARTALNEAKIRYNEEDVLVLYLDNKPGQLADVAEKLSSAKINIRYAYATTEEGYSTASVIIGVNDVDKATNAISAAPSVG
ncbi:MAG: ACT domain-containing protein [Candidatus Kryptoniota bacterium]